MNLQNVDLTISVVKTKIKALYEKHAVWLKTVLYDTVAEQDGKINYSGHIQA